jgi:hypothetical protein
MKYKTVKNLKWVDENHTKIDCEVDFDDLIEEFVPFTADPNDITEHGKEIFAKAVAGEFGTIVEYTPPPLSFYEAMVRDERNWLLSELDLIVSNPLRFNTLTTEQKDELAVYRQALLDVPQQPGFPLDVTFPEKPQVVL